MITKNIHKQVKSIYKYVQSCCKKRNNQNPKFSHIIGDHYIEQPDFIGFSFVDQCLGISGVAYSRFQSITAKHLIYQQGIASKYNTEALHLSTIRRNLSRR